jgi:hypothetical protein
MFADPRSISIISQEDCLEIPEAKLKQSGNVFVFDEFDKKNPAFNYIFTARTVQ